MTWLDDLPRVLQDLESRWSLRIGDPFDEATCSWVAPVALPDETSAVLKLGVPHFEGEHEIQGLRFWNGDPGVRLLAADDTLGAMLLERCLPGTPLRASPEPEQDVVIAALLRRLWRLPPALHPFRRLSDLTGFWINETLAQASHWADPKLTRDGLDFLKELPHTAPAEMLLATDLHAGNVLRAQREPWLVVDPKPFVGDPAFDATQHLLNCKSRLRSHPRETISRFADLLAVDTERVRLWLFARLAAEPRESWDNDAIAQARAVAP
jgi:streptomycin 6-kinase